MFFFRLNIWITDEEVQEKLAAILLILRLSFSEVFAVLLCSTFKLSMSYLS